MSKVYSIAFVGRTNVGKSSLFNTIIGHQRSLVGDIENLTRDLVCEYASFPSGKKVQFLDTAGLESQKGPLGQEIELLTLNFLQSVDVCLLILDASVGLLDADIALYQKLKRTHNTVRILWNKEDLGDPNVYYQAHRLCDDPFYTVEALSQESVHTLLQSLELDLTLAPSEAEDSEAVCPTFGFFGRPNVGKSSLSNVFLGKKKRFLVSSQAGTTRDYSIESLTIAGQKMNMCDTAGMVQTKNTHPELIERMVYYRTIAAMKKVHVAVLVIDASVGLTNLDKRILSLLQKFRRGLVIALNKCDLLSESELKHLKELLAYELKGYSYAPLIEVSAEKRTHIPLLKKAICAVSQAFFTSLTTSQINKYLEELIVKHEPPIRSGYRVKIRYMHIIDNQPLTLMAHGTGLHKLPQSYVRFLKNSFCKQFNLVGIPLKIEFKNTENPYV